MNKTVTFQMKIDHMRGILDSLPELAPVMVGSRASLFSDFDRVMCVSIHSDIQPLFWVAVATWYCEQERLHVTDVPDWTPIDLASDCVIDDMHNFSFPHFQLVRI
jgi:hypothetical protein